MSKIDNKTLLRVLSLTTLFLGLLYLIYLVRAQLVWLAIAFFLTLALEPSVDRLSKYMPRKNRGLAVSLIFVLLIGVLSFIVFSLAPPLISESSRLVRELPEYLTSFLNSDNFISNSIDREYVVNLLEENQGSIAEWIFSNSGTALGVIGSIINSFFGIITILVFTFFMVLEGPKIMASFWKYQPESKRAYRQHLASRIYRIVTDYVNGTFLASIIAAVSTSIMLLIIGVPYTIALGILVAIFDLVPLIGATLAAVIVSLVVLVFGGATKALIVVIFFIVYQILENNVLRPLIFSKSVKISPLVVGVAGLFGAIIAGLVGALVAIPVAATIQLMVVEYLESKKALEESKS